MGSHQDPRVNGFGPGEIIAAVIVVVFIAAVIVPSFLTSSRGNWHERNSSTSLKTLASAEADFRANDRDWNHVNDFWTADVRGLYTMTSAAVPGASPNSTTDPSIKLIELSVASADADDVEIPAGGEYLSITNFAVPSAKAGYWYAALRSDLQAGVSYRQDTGGTPKMGACHHEQKFGFMAFPDSPSAGKYVFMVNENSTIFRMEVKGRFRTGTSNPPGLGAVPPGSLHWPTDATLKSRWSKLD
jgi:type II secretory pathway pseudopilin PulG